MPLFVRGSVDTIMAAIQGFNFDHGAHRKAVFVAKCSSFCRVSGLT